MPAVDVNTTYQPKPVDVERDRPSITRTGADIRLPVYVAESNIVRLLGSSKESDRVALCGVRSPWLALVLAEIASYRQVQPGWDGIDAAVPSHEALDTAEMLAVFLNNAEAKMIFAVDALGRPTFAARSDDFYLHLTVDGPERITWFAEVSGVEHFHDEVEFTGRRLPSELAAIL